MRNLSPFLLVGTLALAGFSVMAAPDAANEAAKIDAILQNDWKKHKLQPNPAADDNTFVRRIYLDLIGRIPTTREAEDFIHSKEADKRAKLIDKLLASEGYVQHFFNYWADVLRLQSNGPQAGGITGAAYTSYLKESLRENKPYDQIVRELVTAQGKAWDNGAIGYYMRDRGMPLDNMANTVRVFLGTRIECAQCHNHPFDKWTQMQFFEMAAFTFSQDTSDYYGDRMSDIRDLLQEENVAVRAAFKEPQRPRRTREMSDAEYARLEKEYVKQRDEVRAGYEAARTKLRKEQRSYQDAMTDVRNNMRYTNVVPRDRRRVTLPHDYQYSDAKPRSPVAPAAMMGHEAVTRPGETPLEAYARWMTSPENPRFTSVIANRLWKKAFGLALIEPLDELMDTTVPMIPEMQAHLEKLMASLKYDMKDFLRVILNTSAYQSQVTKEEIAPGVVYHFTGPVLRRMTAEQMWDSFVTLINPDPDMPGLRTREDMAQRVLQAQKISDSVDALSVEEAFRGIKLAASVYSKNRERTEAKQKLYIEARAAAKEWQDKAELLTGKAREEAEAKAAEFKEKADIHRGEVNAIQREGRSVAMNEIVLNGSKKLYEQVTGKPWQGAAASAKKGKATSGDAGAMMMDGGDSMMSVYGVRMERVAIPGYDRELTPEARREREEKRAAAYDEEAGFFGIPENERRDYHRSRETQIRSYVRAAEIESPAPRGHYLREFGQSDRETIENANHEASVPQALAMMNGQLLPQILAKYSQLMLSINKAPYPDEQVDAAYMAILSRKPTAKEKQTWLAAQDNGLTGLEDLIYALLNTQQFIFVQ